MYFDRMYLQDETLCFKSDIAVYTLAVSNVCHYLVLQQYRKVYNMPRVLKFIVVVHVNGHCLQCRSNVCVYATYKIGCAVENAIVYATSKNDKPVQV